MTVATLKPNAGSMVVGDLWAGVTGNVMVVQEVEGERVLLGYVDDPEDNSWQWSEDVRSTLEYRGRVANTVTKHSHSSAAPNDCTSVCKEVEVEWLCGGCGQPVEQVGAGWKHVNPQLTTCPYPHNERRA